MTGSIKRQILYLVLALAGLALCWIARGAQRVTETADFTAGTGTNGWTQVGDSWRSPAYSNTIVSVAVACSNVTEGAGFRVAGAADNAFLVTPDDGVRILSFSADWIDPRLAVPEGFLVTNITETSFTATCAPVPGALGYCLTLYTNMLVGASVGMEDWRETFADMELSTGISEMNASRIARADHTGWTWSNRVYLADAVHPGCVRLGGSETNGTLLTPPFEGRTAGHLRIIAQRVGQDAGQNLRVLLRAADGAETFLGDCTLAEEAATCYLPFEALAAGDRFVFDSLPVASGREGRVLLDDVALVTGYAPGTVVRVKVREEVSATPFFAWEDVPSVRAELVIRARGEQRTEDSAESSAVSVDFAHPPLAPRLTAISLSDGAYAAPFAQLPVGTFAEWYNGVTPLYGWSAYRGDRLVTRIGYGHAGAGTGTYNLFAAASTNGPVLGSMASGAASIRYGATFRNDTKHLLESFNVSFAAVAWQVANADSAKTLVFGACVTNGCADVAAEGPWQDVPALAFTAPYPAETNFTEALSAPLPGVALRPGEYLVLRWFDAARTHSPGMGVADFHLSFTARPLATLITLK